MIIKRYIELECLASQDDERPYTFYVLIRVHKTWMTKKGDHREKWERTVMTVTGRTKSEAEKKLAKRIQKRRLEPFPVIEVKPEEIC
jgi:hypothetical protein